MLAERGLSDLEVTHGSPGNVLRGVGVALTHPLRTMRLLWWTVRHSGGHPLHLIKALVLLPRILHLFNRLERNPPDVVHLYWGHYPAILGWLVLEYTPHVIVSLSLSAYDLLRNFPGSVAVAKRAHLVSTWAGVNVPAIASRGIPPDSVHVVWQGVDLGLVQGREFRKVPRRIVTTGRLDPEKGTDDVIRAFARVAGVFADASLVVLGDGVDRKRLEQLAATLGVRERVTFRGHVAHHEVFEELVSAEVFLFLSRYVGDRLPNVLKEAMACRCLVVTTETSGIEELVQHGVHGWVVPFDAWEKAAAYTVTALQERESTDAMTTAAQQHVKENFDLVQLMKRMLGHWERCGADDGLASKDRPVAPHVAETA